VKDALAKSGLGSTREYDSDALLYAGAAVEFLKRQPLGPHEMEKVAHGNAERILRL
jgi:hypothetical protein